MNRWLLTGSDAAGNGFESSTSYGFYVGKLEPRSERVRSGVLTITMRNGREAGITPKRADEVNNELRLCPFC
jgi:hypothetical protein